MKLIELITSPWAITPASLEQIVAVYNAHARGDRIDIAAVEARIGRPLANERPAYTVRDGVAVLTLEGVMSPKANMFTEISGGISTQIAAQQLQQAVADPKVNAVVLQFDSPGGNAIGTPELAQAVTQARTQKRVVTFSDGMLASAAYWVGSAAEKVYVSGTTTMVGSIGVVVAHRDLSRAEESAGIKITEISAGKYKRIASQHEPLSAEGRASLQEQVDYVYSLFVDAVAAHRGTSAEAVLERMADGRTFHGRQAVDAGLVDGITTLDALIDELAQAAKPRAAVTGRPRATLSQPAGATMDRETLEREHPQLAQDLRTQFMAEGAAAERTRASAVRAHSLPGHEALIERLAADGTTTGEQAAVAVLNAERSSRSSAAAAHAADAPPAVAAANPPADEKPLDKAAQVQKANAYAAEHKVDFVAAMKALGFAA